MVTYEIKEGQKVLTNKVVEILLWQYNKGVEEPIVLVEGINSGCFSVGLEYTFYRSIPDIPDHYEKGNTLSEGATMMWLAHELNERI